MNFFPSRLLLEKFAPLKPVSQCPSVLAHQADQVFALWDAWEKETGGEREIPYWAVVWPAGISLARYLLNNPDIIRGKSILDIGCGSGIPAIAAKKAGASYVVANDIDPVALHITALHTKANDVILATDDRNLLDKSIVIESYDVILAADMFYQRSDSKHMLDFLNNWRKRGSTVIIADAQRPYAPKNDISPLLTETITVNRDLEGKDKRDVSIFLLND